MEVSASLATRPDTAQAVTSKNLSGISGEDFMKILIKQLQFQDPFEPMSNQEMAAQIATIRELEVNTRLGTKLEQITDQQRFGSSAALIGKYARGSATDAEGTTFEVEGIITGVRFTPSGEVMLELDTGEMLSLAGLEEVTEPNAQP